MRLKFKQLTVWNYLTITYIILLIAAVFYVKSVLGTNSFRASDKSVQKSVASARQVNVTLTVKINGEEKMYQTKLKNMDTVEDLLSDLRDRQGLVYEKTLYTYGVGIDSVLGQNAPVGSKWQVLLDGQDITKDIDHMYLKDGAIYELLVSKGGNGIKF